MQLPAGTAPHLEYEDGLEQDIHTDAKDGPAFFTSEGTKQGLFAMQTPKNSHRPSDRSLTRQASGLLRQHYHREKLRGGFASVAAQMAQTPKLKESIWRGAVLCARVTAQF